MELIRTAGLDLVMPVEVLGGVAGLVLGNCLDALRMLPDNCMDSIVTDPPYGLSFMGKRWDYDVPSVDVWAECLRVLKPGGHLLAFAGTRTQHRMAVRIEDAGFEIRDMIAWVYGSGFPKSLDVSKAIDKAAGVAFDAVPASGVGFVNAEGAGGYNTTKNQLVRKGESTEQARQWQGWGTALKPALEPVTVARKPLIGAVAANVLAWGCGALNVDGCRVGDEVRHAAFTSLAPCHGNALGAAGTAEARRGTQGEPREYVGRWPANLIHDGSEEVAEVFGDPARFFYCAKASKADRNAGCEAMPLGNNMRVNGPRASEEDKHATQHNNTHPTVKPTDLMRYLCRLVTPPGGVVLDPFMGSGSTGKAAILEGFRFVGCELSPEHMAIASARILHAVAGDLA